MTGRLAFGAEPARVAIVDDHQLIGASLATAFRAEGAEVLVPSLDPADDLEAELRAFGPHVVLLDLDLGPAGSGEAIIAPLAQDGTTVVILSAARDEAVIRRCLERGASRWVPKSASYDDLVAVVADAVAGKPLLDPRERERLIDAWRRRRSEERELLGPFSELSRREAEVLEMLAVGRSVERIAEASCVSGSTVRSQVRAVLLKLGVKSQLEAVAKAHRARWPGLQA